MKTNALLILQSVLAIVFGILIILFPIKSLVFLTWFVGAFLFVESIVLICLGIFDKRVHLSSALVQGIVGILLGVTILYWPGMTIKALVLFFALWSIVTGIVQIIRVKKEKYRSDAMSAVVFAGLSKFVFGMLLLVFPQVTIGLGQIFFGITILVSGLGTLIVVAKGR